MPTRSLWLGLVLLSGCGLGAADGTAEAQAAVQQLQQAIEVHQASAPELAAGAACQAELARYDAAARPLLDELAQLGDQRRGCWCCGSSDWRLATDRQLTVLNEHVATACGGEASAVRERIDTHCAAMRRFASDRSAAMSGPRGPMGGR